MATKKRTKAENDLQITTNKTKNRAARIQLKNGDELRCSGKVSSSRSTSKLACICIYSSCNS